ncbi:YbhB/YbcL family Raf kinase inhibitor-like protein [Orrella sp. NBD-18]|uniref:YbhB/YbcL family Raf kinase inhibitor-like protein n=1 Tax=Sheuella amnicola TaxID=2707330 RepID=A0A6B2R227_9BURK|nr:YbhB/YbcL family Raf kinase inhibitor-like protein [Sheuella amnicola]NDY84282.1 YbhB/YbcL family Raf kinase inhibitor-like protein [Sheuella amnicola]
MKLTSTSFTDQSFIPARYAFGKIDKQMHVALSDNMNPHFSWDDVPAGTKSFVLICHDVDVPSRPDDVNQEGCEIPSTLPRIDFYHWVLVDIDASTRSISEGGYSSGISPRGKGGPIAANGTRQGINDYTAWFASDRDMSGDYFGYDGPCPPWNDSILHHYVFTLYALDIERIALDGHFNGPQVIKAIEGHVLAKAAITGIYTLNPALAKA